MPDFLLEIGTEEIPARMIDSEDELDVEYEGEPFSLLINVGYFIDSLSAVDTEKISLEFHQEGSPIIIRPEPTKDYFNLVMPMRR